MPFQTSSGEGDFGVLDKISTGQYLTLSPHAQQVNQGDNVEDIQELVQTFVLLSIKIYFKSIKKF